MRRLVKAVDEYLKQSGDTLATVRKKRIVVLTCGASCVTFGTTLFTDVQLQEMSMHLVGALSNFITAILSVLWVLTTRSASNNFVYTTSIVFSVGLFLQDWWQASRGPLSSRQWPVFIIMIDVLLVCRGEYRLDMYLMMACAMWVVITGFEDHYRMGLYDVAGTSSLTERLPLTCSTPPCSRDANDSIINMLFKAVVLLVDYYFTRSFAVEIFDEKRLMEVSVEGVNVVATHLESFDLQTAEQCLLEIPSLPQETRCALLQLLHNLKVFKPYLPRACLPAEESDQEDSVDEVLEMESLSGKNKTRRKEPCYSVSHVVEQKRGAVIVTNMKGTHTESNGKNLQERHSLYTTNVLGKVEQFRGVLHLIFGDHLLCSFNVSQRCLAYCKASVNAAVAVQRWAVGLNECLSVAVVSGSLLAGDLGSPDAKQYSIVSENMCIATGIERYCAKASHKILVNKSIYMETQYMYDFKLVLKILKKKNSTIYTYELLNIDACPEADDSEWMYGISTASSTNDWATYNAAGLRLLKGASLTDTLSRSTDLGLLTIEHREALLSSMPIEGLDL